ncbi:MAG: HDOD domain-containing protein [Campylobacterota bacterium]|nr:HDOD domain-containing protein [Campylobacterota bacterium]
MNFESIVKNIESLPPLSDAIIKIRRLFNEDRDDIDVGELVLLIESDALLAANILKITNSSLYGFSRKISSIRQAVTLLGMLQINSLIINYAIDENIKANTGVYRVSNEKFNDMCHIQTSMVSQWYSKINFKDAQFLSSLALIMESGKLILAQEITSSSYEKDFQVGLVKCDNIEKYEDSLIGTTSYKLTALLFEHWNLDPLYSQILESLDKTENIDKDIETYVKVINIIKTAVNVKELLTKQSVLKAVKLLKEMDLEVEPFIEVAIKIKKSYVDKLKERQESK